MRGQPFFIPAAAFIVLAVPLALGLVPPNRFYGVRTAKTLADPGLWRRANRFCGVLLGLSGALYLTVAALTPAADGKDPALWLLHLAAFVLPLAASLLAAAAYLRRS